MESRRLSGRGAGALRRVPYPRNALGAERASAAFAGGEVDNWNAYPINAQSPAPVPWHADALFGYLRDGWHRDHGVARGPMSEVVGNLAGVPDSDIRAIATYMAAVFGAPPPDRQRRGEEVLAQVKSSAPAAKPGMIGLRSPSTGRTPDSTMLAALRGSGALSAVESARLTPP